MYGFFNNKRIVLYDILLQQILITLQLGKSQGSPMYSLLELFCENLLVATIIVPSSRDQTKNAYKGLGTNAAMPADIHLSFFCAIDYGSQGECNPIVRRGKFEALIDQTLENDVLLCEADRMATCVAIYVFADQTMMPSSPSFEKIKLGDVEGIQMQRARSLIVQNVRELYSSY
ncbi:hypothetical protein Cgig2_003588 [Carnegiea gigantea]|uniref:Uncharacterized protein n=1 Tax=Carnegiea gigantea TaxID=171969 RepID=A0A9Q1JFN6_9CARY|nr:hypothetical protein Cgig2_003588 [Carnegiea gigantea]